MSGLAWQEVGDGVFRRRYQSLDLNIGLVVGAGETLLVDTRATHAQADELRAEIAVITRLPIRYVVNTHHHWDHTFGNARFADAELVGHERCAAQLVATGDAMKEQLRALVAPSDRPAVDAIDIVPPSTTFHDHLDLEVGGRTVRLVFHGRAHTDNDIVVTVDDVVFAGDIIEESAPPYFGDAFPLEWPETVESALVGSMFIPGHGDVMAPGRVTEQLEELRLVRDKVEACLEPDTPISEGPYPLEVMQTALQRGRLTSPWADRPWP